MVEFVTELRGMLGSWAATPVWSALGWTMWYSVWIGLVQLGIGGVVMTLLRRASSELRYRVLLVLFGVLAATPAGIFLRVFPAEGELAEFRAAMEVNWVPAVAGESEIPGEGAGKFVEPDRMPNALRSPWKPEEAGVSEPSGRVLVVPSRSVESAVDLPGGRGGWGAGAVNAWLVAGVQWLPLVWILGSPVTLACLGLGLIGAERYRRGARVLRNGAIVEQCRQLAERVGMRRGVFVGISERVVSPILIGIVRPLILLPITAETGWTPAQLEMVLLHELAHVRRWDNLVNLLQRLAEGVLFFQPAVWIVSRWLTLEREHCCDALVVKVTGRAQDYATALAELAMAEHFPPGVASAMARHPLLGRIRRILGKEQPLQVSRGTLAVGLIVTVCCCALAGLVQGVEETEPPKKEAGVVIEGYAEGEKKVEGEGIAKRWRVVDVTGKPIEGVEVSAFSGGRSYPPETWKTPELKDPKNLIGKFTSDAEGKVQVQTPDEKPFILEFKKPGFMTLLKYSESWKRWGEDQARPEFVPTELMRAGTITVEVRGVDGLPASGVKLVCANYFHSKSLMDSTKFTNAVTDEKGQAVLTNLREGLVNLECTHTGSDQIKRTWSDCLILADGAKLIVRIDLAQSNSTINGSVKDDLNQTPLSDVTIEVEREWSFNEAAKTLDEATRRRILEGMPTNQVTFPRDLLTHGRYQIIRKWKGIQTDAEGKFDIGKIPAGNYHLTFTREPPSFHIPGTEFKQKIAEKDINLPANETVPIEVLADESSLGQQANRKSILPPVSSSDSERVTEIDSEHSVAFDSLPAKINLAIKSAGDRRLTAGLHTPWQVVQAIHGLKRDAELITPEGKKINALEWLATARTFQNEPLFEKTEWGGRAHPFNKPFVFEGHPTQFLAILSSCDLPLDYEFQTADGSPITVQDILNDAKMRVEEGTDLTWTLWALVHYLPVDASWKNSKGEDWSIERLVRHVSIPKSGSASNAGSDMLYVLAYARHQYLKTGKPLEGSWLRADELLRNRVRFFEERLHIKFEVSSDLVGTATGIPNFRKYRTANVQSFDWLVMALSPEQLEEDRIRERIESLADYLYENREKSVDVGPFFHAIDAMNLYRHKTSPNPKPLAYPLTGVQHTQPNLSSADVLGLKEESGQTLTPDETNPKNLQIAGQVLDDQGNPLVGAIVRAYIRGTAGRDDRELARTETNSQGQYKIHWYRGEVGNVFVEVSRTGYLTEEKEALEITRFPDAIDSTFRMVKGASVEVTVLGDDDKPLKDALVMVITQHRSRYYMEMTDEEGKFKLTDLVPGEASLTYPPLGFGGSNEELLLTSVARTLTDEALKKKFPGRYRGLDHHVPIENVVYLGEFDLVAGETASTTIRLSECSSQLHGRVVDQNGQPLKEVPLSLGRISKDVPMERIPEENGVLKASRRLWTDDEGRYRIDRINPGRYEIQTSHDLGRNLQGKRHTFVIGEKEDRVETLVMTSKNRQISQPIEPPAPPGPQPSVPPTAVKKSPLVHIELTGDSVRVLPENLRYDGKSFSEWVEVLRTEIKTERVVEAIEVMLYFGSKGYQLEAASEVVTALRRISSVQEIRERTSSALILSKAIITLNLLGKDSVPSLAEMLRDQDDSQVIIGLEFLSRFSTEPWDWPDKLPEPTSAWQAVPPSFGENQEHLVRFPPWCFSPEIGKELSRLLKHPNPEIRARLTPVALRCHALEELPEVLNESLTDLAPAVWFNSLVFLETYKSLLQVSPNYLRDIFRKLKEEGKFKGDPIRRNLYLRSILSDLSNNPPEETIQYIPDILDDLKATPIYEETAYWHLMLSAIPVSSEKAESLRDALRKAAADLAGEEKIRVEGTLKGLDPEIDQRFQEKKR